MSDPDLEPATSPIDRDLIQLRNRADTLERQLSDARRDNQERLVRAELKAEAIRAGMIDLDGLKLLDLSEIKLDAHGEVKDAAALMAEFRRNKAWLFGSPSSSSSANPPPAQQPRQKMATDMTPEEYRVARAALLKRRG